MTIQSDPLSSVDYLPEWACFIQESIKESARVPQLRVIHGADVSVDLTYQLGSPGWLHATHQLLKARGFRQAQAKLLRGDIVNPSEQRPAWHTALREPDCLPEIAHQKERMKQLSEELDQTQAFSDILHIGIGGSDWGPRLCLRALSHLGIKRRVRFVSNVDAHAIQSALIGLNPQKTMVIVSSKSFTTIETLSNAQVALNWLHEGGVVEPKKQLFAVTSRPQQAINFGIDPEHVFTFWDWVGGRYSIWSTIALPVVLALGYSVYQELLNGAHAMDVHFLEAPTELNLPVQLAMVGIANRNAFNYASQNIAAYDARLVFLSPYLQQLEMESLGKSVDMAGRPLNVATGPVVWGTTGTDAQHTFFQWLHQSQDTAPVDFIVCKQPDHDYPDLHRLLLSNCLAQRNALKYGKTYDQAYNELSALESSDQRDYLAKQKQLPGHRPSTLIVLPALTPKHLGAILAMYEHKVFTQAVIWGINPFDQWGVEEGKVLANTITNRFQKNHDDASDFDESTQHWIDNFFNH